jgi:hypothetical protein
VAQKPFDTQYLKTEILFRRLQATLCTVAHEGNITVTQIVHGITRLKLWEGSCNYWKTTCTNQHYYLEQDLLTLDQWLDFRGSVNLDGKEISGDT